MKSKQIGTHYLLNFKSLLFAKLKNVGGACSAIFWTSDFKLWQKFGHSLKFAEPWSRPNLKYQVCVFEEMKSKQVSKSVLFAKVRRWCVLSCYRTAASGQPVTVKAPAADGEAERFPRQLRLVDVSEAEVEMSDSGLICERLWETVARRQQLGWPHWSQSSRCQLLALCTRYNIMQGIE